MRNATRLAKVIVAEATLALPPGATILEDNAQWKNRFEVRSETSDRVYIVSQNKARGHWGCSCPAWRTRRKCKHLRALGLPEFEKPHQVTIARRLVAEGTMGIGGAGPTAPDEAQAPGRTRSFTPEQAAEVDAVLAPLVQHSVKRINAEAERIMGLDKRPRQTHTPEQPDVFFPYVAQAMLEDLIHDLQELV